LSRPAKGYLIPEMSEGRGKDSQGGSSRMKIQSVFCTTARQARHTVSFIAVGGRRRAFAAPRRRSPALDFDQRQERRALSSRQPD